MTRPTRRASRFLAGIGVAALAVALSVVVAAPAHAATFVATDAASLNAAIVSANASAGPDIISIEPPLPGNTITMTASNPQVTGQITVVGNASNPPTIIGPSVAAPIFQMVSATDDFEADNVKFVGQATSGSALTFVSSTGAVTLIGDTFSNFPHQGVELLAQSGLVTITNCTFDHNESLNADANGGAISASSVVDVTITGSNFNHNTAGHHGGAIFFGAAHAVNISGTTFDSNTATDDGGAVEVTSITEDSTWTGNSFTGNTAGGTASIGGAAFMIASVAADTLFVIDRSSFSGNTATAHAAATSGAVGYIGAINGTVQVTNSTMTGNSFTGVGPAASGFGIDVAVAGIAAAGEFDLIQSTFNESGPGSDLVYVNTNAGLLRSASNTLTGPGVFIVSNNTNTAANAVEARDTIAISTSPLVAFDISDTPAVISYSITSDTASPQLVDLGSTQFGVTDAQLGALGNNGGPTQTRLPLAGSPAIDAGDPTFTTPVTDQRGTGFARIINGRVDIGAVESPLPTLAATGVNTVPTVWAASTSVATGALLLGALLLLRRRRNTAQ
jgi:predicted outer membrane repeat protein